MSAWTQFIEPGPALVILVLVSTLQLVNSAPFDESDHSSEIEYYPVADATGCYYNFEHYDEGDRIITNEPCLNCTCHNRMLMCYLRVCPFTKAIGQDCKVEKKADQCCPVITCPEVPVQLLSQASTTPSTQVGHLNEYGCSIDNLFYADGAKVPSNPNNPCEVCYCIRNKTACIIQDCTLTGKVVEGCRPVYVDGVCCPVRYDCEHPELETTPRPLLTTTTTTLPPTSAPNDCIYNNEIYSDGALVKKDVPCEKCYCMRGDIVCAVQECGPTPLDKVNCTALPAKEDQCCPDTYECKNISDIDLTTLSYYEPPTTLPTIISSGEGTATPASEEVPEIYGTQEPTAEKDEIPTEAEVQVTESATESGTVETVTSKFTEAVEAVTARVTEIIEAITSTITQSGEKATTQPQIPPEEVTQKSEATTISEEPSKTEKSEHATEPVTVSQSQETTEHEQLITGFVEKTEIPESDEHKLAATVPDITQHDLSSTTESLSRVTEKVPTEEQEIATENIEPVAHDAHEQEEPEQDELPHEDENEITEGSGIPPQEPITTQQPEEERKKPIDQAKIETEEQPQTTPSVQAQTTSSELAQGGVTGAEEPEGQAPVSTEVPESEIEKATQQPVEEISSIGESEATKHPEAATSEPEAATKEPEAITNEPEVGTEKPEAETKKPEAETKKPEAGIEGPEAETEKPEVVTEELGSGTEGPEAGTEGSGAGTEGFEVGTEGSGAGTEEPKIGGEEPGAGTEGPEAGTKEPAVGTERPEQETESGVETEGPKVTGPKGTETPEAGTQVPEAGTQVPEAGTQGPEVVTQEPEAGTQVPEAGTEVPKAGTETATNEPKATEHPEAATKEPGLSTTEKSLSGESATGLSEEVTSKPAEDKTATPSEELTTIPIKTIDLMQTQQPEKAEFPTEASLVTEAEFQQTVQPLRPEISTEEAETERTRLPEEVTPVTEYEQAHTGPGENVITTPKEVIMSTVTHIAETEKPVELEKETPPGVSPIEETTSEQKRPEEEISEKTSVTEPSPTVTESQKEGEHVTEVTAEKEKPAFDGSEEELEYVTEITEKETERPQSMDHVSETVSPIITSKPESEEQLTEKSVQPETTAKLPEQTEQPGISTSQPSYPEEKVTEHPGEEVEDKTPVSAIPEIPVICDNNQGCISGQQEVEEVPAVVEQCTKDNCIPGQGQVTESEGSTETNIAPIPCDSEHGCQPPQEGSVEISKLPGEQIPEACDSANGCPPVVSEKEGEVFEKPINVSCESKEGCAPAAPGKEEEGITESNIVPEAPVAEACENEVECTPIVPGKEEQETTEGGTSPGKPIAEACDSDHGCEVVPGGITTEREEIATGVTPEKVEIVTLVTPQGAEQPGTEKGIPEQEPEGETSEPCEDGVECAPIEPGKEGQETTEGGTSPGKPISESCDSDHGCEIVPGGITTEREEIATGVTPEKVEIVTPQGVEEAGTEKGIPEQEPEGETSTEKEESTEKIEASGEEPSSETETPKLPTESDEQITEAQPEKSTEAEKVVTVTPENIDLENEIEITTVAEKTEYQTTQAFGLDKTKTTEQPEQKGTDQPKEISPEHTETPELVTSEVPDVSRLTDLPGVSEVTQASEQITPKGTQLPEEVSTQTNKIPESGTEKTIESETSPVATELPEGVPAYDEGEGTEISEEIPVTQSTELKEPSVTPPATTQIPLEAVPEGTQAPKDIPSQGTEVPTEGPSADNELPPIEELEKVTTEGAQATSIESTAPTVPESTKLPSEISPEVTKAHEEDIEKITQLPEGTSGTEQPQEVGMGGIGITEINPESTEKAEISPEGTQEPGLEVSGVTQLPEQISTEATKTPEQGPKGTLAPGSEGTEAPASVTQKGQLPVEISTEGTDIPTPTEVPESEGPEPEKISPEGTLAPEQSGTEVPEQATIKATETFEQGTEQVSTESSGTPEQTPEEKTEAPKSEGIEPEQISPEGTQAPIDTQTTKQGIPEGTQRPEELLPGTISPEATQAPGHIGTEVPEQATIKATETVEQGTEQIVPEISKATEQTPQEGTQAPAEKEASVTEPSVTESATEVVSVESEGEEQEHGIPGEGSCLVDGRTYKNNSNVPPINQCQTSCKCVSSILQCESVSCTPPPSNLQDCMPIFQSSDSCCPTYSCSVPGVTSMESDSHIVETTTAGQEEKPVTIGIQIITGEDTTAKSTSAAPAETTVGERVDEATREGVQEPEIPKDYVPVFIEQTTRKADEVPVTAEDKLISQAPTTLAPEISPTETEVSVNETDRPEGLVPESQTVAPLGATDGVTEIKEGVATELPIKPEVPSQEEQQPAHDEIENEIPVEPISPEHCGTESCAPRLPTASEAGSAATTTVEQEEPSKEPATEKPEAIIQPSKEATEGTEATQTEVTKPEEEQEPSAPVATESASTEKAATEQEITEQAGTEKAVTEQTSAVTEQAPAATEQAPAVTEQAPAVTEQAPAVTEHAPTVTEQAPAVIDQAPAVSEQEGTEQTATQEAVTEQKGTEDIVSEHAGAEIGVTEPTGTEKAVTEQVPAVTKQEDTKQAVTEVSTGSGPTSQPEGQQSTEEIRLPSVETEKPETATEGITAETESTEKAHAETGTERISEKESSTSRESGEPVTEGTSEETSKTPEELAALPEMEEPATMPSILPESITEAIQTDVTAKSSTQTSQSLEGEPSITTTESLPENIQTIQPTVHDESETITEGQELEEPAKSETPEIIPTEGTSTVKEGPIEKQTEIPSIPADKIQPTEPQEYLETTTPSFEHITEAGASKTGKPIETGAHVTEAAEEETDHPKLTTTPSASIPETTPTQSVEEPVTVTETEEEEVQTEILPQKESKPEVPESYLTTSPPVEKETNEPTASEEQKPAIPQAQPEVTESEFTALPPIEETSEPTASEETEPAAPEVTTASEQEGEASEPTVTETEGKGTEKEFVTSPVTEAVTSVGVDKEHVKPEIEKDHEVPAVGEVTKVPGIKETEVNYTPLVTETEIKEGSTVPSFTTPQFEIDSEENLTTSKPTLQTVKPEIETAVPTQKPQEGMYTSAQLSTERPSNASELYTSGPSAEQSTKRTVPGELSTSVPLTTISAAEPATSAPTYTEAAVPSHDIPGEQVPELPDYQSPVEDYEEEDQGPLGPGTCRYGGKVYVSAQQIPRDDPCDFCFCFRSDIICLQQSCPPPIPRCHEEPIRGFCCPRYECPVGMATAVNVTTSTTTTTTTLPPHFLPHAYKGRVSKSGCQIKGRAYQVGDVISAASGPCLHCTCGGDGEMKCDPKACSPEPMLRQMIAAAASRRRR